MSFERAARIVNGFLERQSDCSIPSLMYRAGLTAVTKMQGQDCHIHWKQVDMILRYYLVDQYWVHQVSSACPTTPENEMGQSDSGTEMSIQYILQ